jgi:hypothetical protein
MLRRISTVAAAVAMLGLCALPASAATTAAHASKGSFTVPAASSVVKAWGTYDKINAHRVKVTICAKKTGNASWVGAEAFAYTSNYKQHVAIAGVVGPDTPGQQSCGTAYLLDTAHLKVFTFIGVGGSITKKSSLKSIY